MASWRQGLVAACLMLVCACAQAAVRLQAATLAVPGVQMSGVRAEAMLGADGRPALQIKAARVSVPALGWRDVALTLQGEPQRAGDGAWKFVGHVATQKAPGNALADADLTILYDGNGGTLEVDVTQGKGSLNALLPLDQTSHVQMKLAALPLAWLRGMLAAAWPEGRLTDGTLAGDVALDLASGDTRVSGRVTVADAGLDSKGGTIAAQKLGADGNFRIDMDTVGASVMFDGRLQGGQLVLGPLYAQLPQHSVGLHVSGQAGPLGIKLDSLDVDDPDALRLTGALGFDRHGKLDKLNLKQFSATLPAAYARYGTGLVRSFAGTDAMATSGRITGALNYDDSGLHALDLALKNVSVGSRRGSLAVAGLDGGIDWRAGVSRAATTLKWNALSLYKLTFGPARLGLEDARGVLQLRAPLDVGLFGGTFRLDRLAWQPDAGKAQRLSAAFSVTDVDVDQLCKAFGWPAFGGKLGGAVPDLSYRGNSLAFEGGLSMNVFGGSVSVTDLSMLHPFGPTPEVQADLDFDHIDLAALTGVFGFGQITGPMDGGIHDLKLVNWKPVSFTASLTANEGGRISQNAIKSLTEVGGGGIAGGLQGMALRLFKTFNYQRIGLSCKLSDGVCSMGGITPDPDAEDGGYTIVQGSGLPHITVIGHERAVDWATLVSRLKAVSEGNAPVIR